jgi:hypothetical protein
MTIEPLTALFFLSGMPFRIKNFNVVLHWVLSEGNCTFFQATFRSTFTVLTLQSKVSRYLMDDDMRVELNNSFFVKRVVSKRTSFLFPKPSQRLEIGFDTNLVLISTKLLPGNYWETN